MHHGKGGSGLGMRPHQTHLIRVEVDQQTHQVEEVALRADVELALDGREVVSRCLQVALELTHVPAEYVDLRRKMREREPIIHKR